MKGYICNVIYLFLLFEREVPFITCSPSSNVGFLLHFNTPTYCEGGVSVTFGVVYTLHFFHSQYVK